MKHNQSHRQSAIIYCDGACSGNPGPGGWGTLILNDKDEVEEIGGFEPNSTNNRMEMVAAIAGLNRLGVTKSSQVELYTDSTYLIKGITEWVHGWKKRGWTTSQGEPVANQDLWIELESLVDSLGPTVQWLYVRGHRGIPGNERVDAIAVAFSKQKEIELYKGPLEHYQVDLLNHKHSEEGSKKTSSHPKSKESRKSYQGSSGSKGAYYISYVDRVFQKHVTWSACESRVKGKAGAKFKKISSPEEEIEYRQKWGVP